MSARRTRVAAVVPAAGLGRRLGAGLPKAFVRLLGVPILIRTLRALDRALRFDEILVAVAPERIRLTRRLLASTGLKGVRIVAGGRTRAESVWRALRAVDPSVEWVMVHDAARPLLRPALVRRLLQAARRTGGAIPVLSIASTVRRAEAGGRYAGETVDRSKLRLVQTPQVFKRKDLLLRYRSLGRKAFLRTDEAALFEGTPRRVALVPGEEANLKITTPSDLAYLRFQLAR